MAEGHYVHAAQGRNVAESHYEAAHTMVAPVTILVPNHLVLRHEFRGPSAKEYSVPSRQLPDGVGHLSRIGSSYFVRQATPHII